VSPLSRKDDSGNKSSEEIPAAIPEVVQAAHQDEGDDLKVDENLFAME